MYSEDFDGQYPDANSWCDILIEYDETFKEWHLLQCPKVPCAWTYGECTYAINPNAEPNSPGDVVLMFETEVGWNKSGGKEIAALRYHRDTGGLLSREGCNVLFNDGTVKFIEAKKIDDLNWNEK